MPRNRVMKRTAIICGALLLGAASSAPAQQDPTSDELVRAAEQWAAENLDEDFLAALQGADGTKLRQFLADLQKQFQGEYVLDLAGLKDTIRAFLPLLEQYEESAPYAIWLRTRLDYFDVADRLRQPAPTRKEPLEPKPATTPPPPEKLRQVWIKEVGQRPWPEHAKPYVSKLKPIFTAEKIPAELIWVAEVESSFDPRARSPAGAAGLFQLMPATAKRYGLRTWPFDQRLKPEPSARAAAQYLQYLHKRYRDWRLALAAYNAGEGTVDALFARHKTRSFEKIAPHLPAETQMYVPKFEATLWRREGLKLSDLRLPSKGT